MARKRKHVGSSWADDQPNLLEQWDTSKNGHVKPVDVALSQKVWWICAVDNCGHKCPHSWESTVANRLAGHGCPFCSKNKRQFCVHNSLKLKYPDIAKELDPDLNGSLRSEDLYCRSATKVWFKCPKTNCAFGCPHIYQATVSSRTLGHNQCPFCSKVSRRVCIHNSFGGQHPDLMMEWDFMLNDLDPSKLRPHSSEFVWWRCPNTNCSEKCPHVYSARISHRINMKSGCPFCTSQRICKHNSLASLRPDVLQLWHFDRNKNIDPETMSCKSNQQVWFKCPKTCPEGCIHEWKTTINSVSTGSSCPFCAGRKVCPHTSLAHHFPDLVKEWSPENDASPTALAPFSGYYAKWICNSCGHKWQTAVQTRTSLGSRCWRCSRGTSKMELEIGIVLERMQINTHPAWHVKTIRSNVCSFLRSAEMDKLVELKIHSGSTETVAIEMDGIQHFIAVDFFGGEERFAATQFRDRRKNDSCRSKRAHLLRIGFDVNKYDYLSILSEFFNRVAAQPSVWQFQCVGKHYHQD